MGAAIGATLGVMYMNKQKAKKDAEKNEQEQKTEEKQTGSPK